MMFKHFTQSIFLRRPDAETGNPARIRMTQSELQDLFRSDLEVQSLNVTEYCARSASRRSQPYAA